jgi:hypothetical protein
MALIEMETVSAKKNKLPDGLSDMAEAALLEHITSRSVKLYADQPKAGATPLRGFSFNAISIAC